MRKEYIKTTIKILLSAICAILLSAMSYTDIFAIEIGGGNTCMIAEAPDEAGAIMRMAEGFEAFEESIDLSDYNISPDSLGRLFANAVKNSPYLFYVDNKLSYTYRAGGCVIEITPKYNCSASEARERTEYCKKEVEKIAALAAHGKGELERALLAHDIICRNFSYDLTLESNNIHAFLKEGYGTCQGYAWTYMAVLRALGIECEYAASDTIVHIWLKVKIDGEWYYSDPTWDDPPLDIPEGEISRRHFLFSDIKAGNDGYKDIYSASESICKSQKYDDLDFSSVLSPCNLYGDIDHDGKTELLDLAKLRMLAEFKQGDGELCLICADADGDLLISEKDMNVMRELILTNSVE